MAVPNNSLVDVDDILSNTPSDPDPTNTVTLRHDLSLLCVTDLIDCCETPHTVRGEWYYPDGRIVPYDTGDQAAALRRNRGPNEFRNGRHFYGSVRLFKRWSKPEQRGRFRCELPSAANSSINQTLYANIGEINFKTSLATSCQL